MVNKKSKGINSKLLEVFSIILFWMFITLIVFYLINSFTDISLLERRSINSETELQSKVYDCDDIRIIFSSAGVCYNPVTESIYISVIPISEVEISSAMINVIGEDAMRMFDAKLNLIRSEPNVIKVEYDVNQDGFVELVELVPRFMKGDEEQHCESAKILARRVLSC